MKKTTTTTPHHIRSVKLDPELDSALAQAAATMGLSVSYIMRQSMRFGLIHFLRALVAQSEKAASAHSN